MNNTLARLVPPVRFFGRLLGVTLLSAVTAGLVGAGELPKLTSIDLRGDCRGAKSKHPGRTEQASGRVSLVAHGSEFGHHCGQDQGRFAYIEVEGDFDVSVRVASVTNGGAQRYDGWVSGAKGGLMVRESLDPAARYVALLAVSNDSNVNETHKFVDAFHFDARLDPEAWLGSEPKGRFVYGGINRRDGDWFIRDYPNVWVRLKREGNKFFGFISRDGQTWYSDFRSEQAGGNWVLTPSFHHELTLPRRLYLGVALSASAEGYPNARATAMFQDFSGLPAPLAPAGQ